jgi:hypothetical protein
LSGASAGLDVCISAYNAATGKQAELFLPGGESAPATYLLTAAVALSNSSSGSALANCNLKAGFFQTFGTTSVTGPADGTGNPAVAHALILASIDVDPGIVADVKVECFSGSGAQLLTATVTAVRAGTLQVQ